MKKFLALLLLLCLMVPVLAGCGSDGYDQKYVNGLKGGFRDTLEDNLKTAGMSEETFKSLIKKHASQMTVGEREQMNLIRNLQIKPDEDTLLQKVITVYDMGKYISGEYTRIKGFVYACADVKQYKTINDLYYGLSLGYEGSLFSAMDSTVGIIRFHVENPGDLFVPKSTYDGGSFTDELPFGGMGFSTGTDLVMGTSEWCFSQDAKIKDAQLFEMNADGDLRLRAEFDTEKGTFVTVD